MLRRRTWLSLLLVALVLVELSPFLDMPVAAASADFSVTATPQVLSLNFTWCGNYTISVVSQGNFVSPVKLNVTGLPAETTFVFQPNPVTPPTTLSNLQVCVAQQATPGNYTLTVSGASGRLFHNATNVMLRIQQATLKEPTAQPPTLALPTLPQPSEYVSPGQRFLNLVRSSIQLQQSTSQVMKLSTTSTEASQHVLDVPAQPATFGSSSVTPNYFEPSFVALTGGAYEYSTSFGVYDLIPNQQGTYYVASYKPTPGSQQQISTVFILVENSKGNGKWGMFPNWQLSQPSISASNVQFTASWSLSQGKQQVADVRFNVDFGKTSLPKFSVHLSKTGIPNNCVGIDPQGDCSTHYVWDTVGLKDFQWQWLIVPSAGFDSYQSQNFGTVTLSSKASTLDGLNDAPASLVSFNGGLGAEWNVKGKKPVAFTKSNSANQQPALVTSFDVNDGDIDPTFGISTTGSTSYPTITDTIGTTGSHSSSLTGYIKGFAITASASGILSSIGINLFTAAGNVRIGIYSTLSGGKFSGLLSDSGSLATVGGFHDYPMPHVSIVVTTTYYICDQFDNASADIYYYAFGVMSYVAVAYGAYPDPTGSLSTGSATHNMRINYVQIKGYTKGDRFQYTGTTGAIASAFSFYTHTGAAGDHFTLALYDDSAGSPHFRLWYSASTGSASSTWNVVNYASGTTDNGWGGTLTLNAYYWFVWQWDSTDFGPSYAVGGANTGISKAQTYGTLDSTWSAGTLSTENWSEYLSFSIFTTTWALGGVSNDASGTILTVDSTPYSYGSFPFTLTWASSSTHSVAASTVSAGSVKQYIWSSWTNGDGLSGPSGTYTQPASNQTVTVNFVKQYQIGVNLNGKGTVTKNPSATWYNASSSVVVTVGSDGSNSTSTRSFISSITGSGTGSYTGLTDPFSVTMSSAVNETVAWYTQYHVKLRALDKYSGNALTTSKASGNVTIASTGAQNIQTADGLGYMDFGWYNSSLLIYITCKYAGTVANSTYHLSTYAPSAASYQQGFKYDAYVTSPTVSVSSSQGTDSTVWNFTSYHLVGNSSATFATGTTYVYYYNTGNLAATQAITASFTPVTATQSIAGLTQTAYYNITDGYVWLRTSSTATITVSLSGLTANPNSVWTPDTAQSVPYSFVNGASAAGTSISITNGFTEIQICNPSNPSIIYYFTDTATANYPVGVYSSSYSLLIPTSVTGPNLLRVRIMQTLMNGTKIQVAFVDRSIIITQNQNGVQGGNQVNIVNANMHLQSNPTFEVQEQQVLNETLTWQATTSGQTFSVSSIKFNVPWIQATDPFPLVYQSTSTVIVHIIIKGPFLNLNSSQKIQYPVTASIAWAVAGVSMGGDGSFQVNILPRTGAQAQGVAFIPSTSQIAQTGILAAVSAGVGYYVKRKMDGTA